MTISAGSPTEAHHMWPAYTSSLQMALIPCQKFKKDNNDRSHTSDQDHLQSRCTADIRRLQKSRSLGACSPALGNELSHPSLSLFIYRIIIIFTFLCASVSLILPENKILYHS